MKPQVFFAPAGVPIQCKDRSTLGGVKCTAELGLNSMEMEFVQGVKLSIEKAKEVKETAEKLNIKLSSHAPYFINFCNKDKKATTFRNLEQSATITEACGGYITVFHPGFYGKLSKEEAYRIAKGLLGEIVEKIKQKTKNVLLGAETVGKKSQFGGLDEVIKLSQDVDRVWPVIDFAHIYAREQNLKFRREEDYIKVFDLVEKEIPGYTKRMHIHFSEIEYSEAGERNHLPLGTKHEPDYRPMLKVIKENGYSAMIVSESPKIEFDAIKMMRFFEGLK
ncbi:MAG: TIM barrel protein [Candidatus Anstonellales archaeon]